MFPAFGWSFQKFPFPGWSGDLKDRFKGLSWSKVTWGLGRNNRWKTKNDEWNSATSTDPFHKTGNGRWSSDRSQLGSSYACRASVEPWWSRRCRSRAASNYRNFPDEPLSANLTISTAHSVQRTSNSSGVRLIPPLPTLFGMEDLENEKDAVLAVVEGQDPEFQSENLEFECPLTHGRNSSNCWVDILHLSRIGGIGGVVHGI